MLKLYLFYTHIKLFNLHKNFIVIDYYAEHKMCVNFFETLGDDVFLSNFP